MALVILSGYPCAGKTSRALEIKKMIETRMSENNEITTKEVMILNDEMMGLTRSLYIDSKSEKVARGDLLSQTIRYLSKERIVICDGMNYIKGFRYQLYCAAREAGVRNCTVHVAAIPSDCIARNAGLPDNSRYCSQTIENLISRFEEPNANSRWDSPLIVFPWCDALVSNSSTNREGLAGKLQGLRVIETHESKPVVMPEDSVIGINPGFTIWSKVANEIWSAITTGNLKPATAAVKASTRTSPNFLHLLESTTSTLVAELLSNLNQSPHPYGLLKFPINTPQSSRPKLISINIPMGKTINLGTLQRLKRQYTTLQKQTNFAGRGNTNSQVEEILDGFVQYLQGTL